MFTVTSGKQFVEMTRAKQLIEQYIAASVSNNHTQTSSSASVMDEIKKASELRDAGIISEEDFQRTKNKLLGL